MASVRPIGLTGRPLGGGTVRRRMRRLTRPERRRGCSRADDGELAGHRGRDRRRRRGRMCGAPRAHAKRRLGDAARGRARARPGRQRRQLGDPPHGLRFDPRRARDAHDHPLDRTPRELLEELAIPVWRCGAQMRPTDDEGRLAVAEIARNASQQRRRGPTQRRARPRYSRASRSSTRSPTRRRSPRRPAAEGRRSCSTRPSPGLRAEGEEVVVVEVEGGPIVRAGAVVNCAGLYADRIARLAGDASFAIYPRKGEFLVFRMPQEAVLDRILLPVPSSLGKGVLVFPTLAGELVAGPDGPRPGRQGGLVGRAGCGRDDPREGRQDLSAARDGRADRNLCGAAPGRAPDSTT